MSKQHDQDQLKAALARLPEHTPPQALWVGIERKLEAAEKQQQKLQAALAGLPTYAPGPDLWERIEGRLPHGKAAPKVVRLPSRAILRYAAVLILAIGSFGVWQWYASTPAETVTLRLSSAPAAGDLFPTEITGEAEDEALIRQVVRQFSGSGFARRTRDYQRILGEWQELDAARKEIEEAIRMFGMDPDLIRELKDIELARTEVVKTMAARI